MANETDQDTGREDPKVENLLLAAKAAFMEFGYAATSMDHVAQRAKASKTTLYTRFPSKEALFAACIEAECERRGLDFTPSNFIDLPVEEALTRIGVMLAGLLWSWEARRIEQMVTGEAGRFPEIAGIFYHAGPERVIEAVTAYFTEIAARRTLPIDPEDASFYARQFITAFKGGPFMELMMGVMQDVPPAPERQAYVVKVVDLFLNGVRGR